MAIYPVKFFTRENVRLRWREEYKSRPLAEKAIGHPKGVYFGFLPSVIGDVVSLIPDPNRNASVFKVPSGVDPGGMNVAIESTIDLDFSLALPGEFPAYVVATADYSRTGDTVGKIEARTIQQVVGEFLDSPATEQQLDLSAYTLASAPVHPTTLVINVDTVGFGPDTITDDGRGNLVSANGLSAPGTINYQTGALTGTTSTVAASPAQVTADYQVGLLPTECLICVVDGPAGSISVDLLPPVNRDEPVARDSVPYGYMPAGSVETLADAVEAVNEVIAARLDLDGTTQDSLSDRLAKDLGAEEMAERLATVVRILRSNDHAGASGEAEVNISGSLSEVNRDHNPKLTLLGGGSETQIGAITTPERNTCVVVNADTGHRLVDPETRELVFGRHEGPEEQIVAGTGITFIQAATGVTGEGTSFTSLFDPGDLIEGADGLFYEVESITSATQLLLKDAYLGATETVTGISRRRFTLKLRKFVEGAESEHKLDADTTIRCFFPAFVDHSVSSFDAGLFLHAPGERPPLPEADTVLAGKVKLAESTGLTGSINIEEDGTPIGKFSVLDFPTAQISVTAPGEVTIAEIGPAGGTGSVGPTGGTGPTGPPGTSFTALNLNEFDTEQQINNPPGGVTITHTADMGHTIGAIYGWWPRLRARPGTAWSDADVVEITDISAAGTIGTIEVFGSSTTRVNVTLYLSSAGFV